MQIVQTIYMKLLLGLCRVLAFIGLSTLNLEYLVNRQSNTIFTFLAVIIEILLIWFLIVPLLKKIIQ
jgi:hypothetical protein